MKLSKLISKLQEKLDHHGDIEVLVIRGPRSADPYLKTKLNSHNQLKIYIK